jgi:hypothetical protein
MLAQSAAIILALGWLAASALWGALALMGGVMANDAGRAPSETHARLVGLMLVGIVAAGLAGPVAGAAVFFEDARRPLLWAAALLLAGGLGLQASAWFAFSRAAGG